MSGRERSGLLARWFRGGGTDEAARDGNATPDAPAADAPREPDPVPQRVPEAPPEPAPPGPEVPPEPVPPREPAPEPVPEPPPDEIPAPGPEVVPGQTAEPGPARSWFRRLADGLSRSSNALTQNLTGLLTKRRLDEDTLQDLEDALIQADLGVDTATRITGRLAEGRYDREIDAEEVRAVLAAEVERVLAPVAVPLDIDAARRPHVVLVVGVNGSGKTTTIGKLAAKLTAEGRSVVLAAGDTFRAAAIEQLVIWGERTGAPVVARAQGADASGLAYDALEKARAGDADVLLMDTAGRLQNKAHLMGELEKIVRVLRKQDETAPHSVLLVLDATTGQNALNQVEIFRQVCGVTGLVMTKLDGTARGGILVAIAAKHALPVHFIGVGEGVDDLQPFDAGDFARAIAGNPAEDRP